jgi:hypothetical protein
VYFFLRWGIGTSLVYDLLLILNYLQMKEVTIKDFIQKSIQEVESALSEGYAVSESIDFEVSVITSESKNGAISIKIASGNYADNQEVVQRLNFSIVNVAQKESDFRKSGDTFIEYIGKGMAEMIKAGSSSGIDENQKVRKSKRR